jgi:uroporphyrin-III C-methyltransferase
MALGKVYFVGAGPGDPKLLTMRAIEVFKFANVVLYDRLVSKEIISLLPREISKFNVGKAPHGEGMSQKEINYLLIKEAKSGKNVLRLKGGDPLLFSRGEEEIIAIEAEGIEYEVVPGVSSAIGVPSYLGIPLTRRGASSSIAIVTGHEDSTKTKKSVDFQKLASSVDTIVILMGVAKLQQISEQLLGGGLAKDTPVAVIEAGTTQAQRIHFSNLANIHEGSLEGEIRTPALIVVGEVARGSKRRWERSTLSEQLLSFESNSNENDSELQQKIPITWCAATEFS